MPVDNRNSDSPVSFIRGDVQEIRLKLERISTKLDDLSTMNHENRIKELELWKGATQGYRSAIHYMIDFIIGITGVLLGGYLF